MCGRPESGQHRPAWAVSGLGSELGLLQTWQSHTPGQSVLSPTLGRTHGPMSSICPRRGRPEAVRLSLVWCVWWHYTGWHKSWGGYTWCDADHDGGWHQWPWSHRVSMWVIPQWQWVLPLAKQLLMWMSLPWSEGFCDKSVVNSGRNPMMSSAVTLMPRYEQSIECHNHNIDSSDGVWDHVKTSIPHPDFSCLHKMTRFAPLRPREISSLGWNCLSNPNCNVLRGLIKLILRKLSSKWGRMLF